MIFLYQSGADLSNPDTWVEAVEDVKRYVGAVMTSERWRGALLGERVCSSIGSDEVREAWVRLLVEKSVATVERNLYSDMVGMWCDAESSVGGEEKFSRCVLSVIFANEGSLAPIAFARFEDGAPCSDSARHMSNA